MNALDFEYDGQYLSDYGFIVCDFDDKSGVNVVSAGAQITFNKVSRHNGRKNSLVSTKYVDSVQSTFDICKNPEVHNDLEIGSDEYRDLMRWLNRNEFLKFQVLFDNADFPYRTSCYYEASFNIEKIIIGEKIYGLRLIMETNAPFGYGEEQHFVFNISNTNTTYSLFDISDEIGFIYPSVKITCLESGQLSITNWTENCTMVIKGCQVGEVINIDGDAMLITTSSKNHDICNDFNYEFLKIGNTFDNRENIFTASLRCNLEISYYPIIKESV